ncbi:MAG TPA: hypothetical protein VFM48_06590 [Aquabacterium sp.]|nr:hypothetical protein [Aquabacterium sp.]
MGCLLVVVGVSHSQESAAESTTVPSHRDDMWLTVSDQRLDDLRGGFDVGSVLMVSFGISRVVYINDQLVTSTSLQLGDLGTLSSAQAKALGQELASMAGQVVQNGPGNSVDPAAMAVPFATYIQNTLNNQSIRVETMIQATTNGMSLLKGLNFQSLIHDAVTSALVTH